MESQAILRTLVHNLRRRKETERKTNYVEDISSEESSSSESESESSDSFSSDDNYVCYGLKKKVT